MIALGSVTVSSTARFPDASGEQRPASENCPTDVESRMEIRALQMTGFWQARDFHRNRRERL
jgi:hypothetical protein